MSKAIPIGKAESDNSWQAEDDLRTLIRAEQIKADPKRYAAAKRKAKQRKEELAIVEGLANSK